MSGYFNQLSSRIKVWECQCGQSIFFRNSQCLACSSALGYWPQLNLLGTLKPAQTPDIWALTAQLDAGAFRRCTNLDTPAACNWLVPADSPEAFCQACRLNRTIPDLSIPQNHERWRKVETAKRRMVAQLISAGLPVVPREEGAESGLAFDFIGVDLAGKSPTTGHANGLITLDIKEADDAFREQMRVNLHEPYRTLLGHFRHEVGHYYWDLLVAQSQSLDAFRQVFGDERQSYADALQRHYEQGPPGDWADSHISAYATMHPWEDWAETWAHYLHMMDALDTAQGFGMNAQSLELDYPPYSLQSLYDPRAGGALEFLGFINAWIELSGMLNELSRSMGQVDFYPFVLSAPVVVKLQFVHLIVQGAQSISHGISM